MRPRVLNAEQRAEVERVVLQRLEARKIPSDKVLARRFGCGVWAIKGYVRETLKTVSVVVSRGTTAAHDLGAIPMEKSA